MGFGDVVLQLCSLVLKFSEVGNDDRPPGCAGRADEIPRTVFMCLAQAGEPTGMLAD